MLELFFACNRQTYVNEGLHINERVDVVAAGKNFNKPGFVLMDPLFDVICDADIQCKGLVYHDLNVIGLAA